MPKKRGAQNGKSHTQKMAEAKSKKEGQAKFREYHAQSVTKDNERRRIVNENANSSATKNNSYAKRGQGFR